MKRSIRRLASCGFLVSGFLVLAASGQASADNLFPEPGPGNVGIGTTTPGHMLDIVGSNASERITASNAGGFSRLFLSTPNREWRIVNDGSGGDKFVIYDGTAGATRLVIDPLGNVGIGTSNPNVRFGQHLDTTAAGDYGGMSLSTFSGNHFDHSPLVDFNRSRSNSLGTQTAVVAGDTLGAFVFRGSDGSGFFSSSAVVGSADGPISTNVVPGRIAFFTAASNGAITERVRVNSAGNVGIGTTTPAARLHVAGDAQVDGNLAAKYQDVAEWVQSARPLSPGVVVVVDPQSRNQVLAASGSYDTRVAGVVSARPGLLLGEAGDGKVKVAHSGRVKVKVDASYGAVSVGDLLVTSPTAGHAMRSIPVDVAGTALHRPGTLLGKALEPLDAGQGEILVLLTLQ